MVSRSLDYSNASTLPTNTPVLAWALRSAKGSLNGLEAGCGWSLNQASDQPSPSRFPSAIPDLPQLAVDSVYILVVEDNPADVSLLRQALLEHGVNLPIVVVSDGEKAMRFVDRSRAELFSAPKLIVLDLNLPKRHGREVLEYIRAQNAWNKVPLAVLSSSAAMRDRDDAQRLGASRYIRKPLDLDEFIAIGSALKDMLSSPQP